MFVDSALISQRYLEMLQETNYPSLLIQHMYSIPCYLQQVGFLLYYESVTAVSMSFQFSGDWIDWKGAIECPTRSHHLISFRSTFITL